MTDKINELKALIETLTTDSLLRKSLEEALEAEQKRNADEKTEEAAHEEEISQSDEEENAGEGDTDLSSEFIDGIAGKLDKLLDNDEFVAASAGFLLGAVTAGAGALALSALKE